MSDLTRKRSLDSGMRGKEIFEITPVIVGGSPTDPANKVLLTREEHMQAVRFWNAAIAKHKAEHGL